VAVQTAQCLVSVESLEALTEPTLRSAASSLVMRFARASALLPVRHRKAAYTPSAAFSTIALFEDTFMASKLASLDVSSCNKARPTLQALPPPSAGRHFILSLLHWPLPISLSLAISHQARLPLVNLTFGFPSLSTLTSLASTGSSSSSEPSPP
jgi:hypothetical protein